MRTLRRFEKRLQRLFEEPFTRAFKGGVHPLEIARRLMREVDDNKVLGVSETLAPNHFLVRLSPTDYENLSGVAGSLAAEMEALVITHTNQRGYHLITRPRVDFASDASLREGEFSLLASLDEPVRDSPPGERIVEGRTAPAESRLGALTMIGGERAGTTCDLGSARIRIGRAQENDLVLADPRASRFHAEIERAPAGYIIRDLGSTNGTMVRGRKVHERLLENGDTIVVGSTEMLFTLAADRREGR